MVIVYIRGGYKSFCLTETELWQNEFFINVLSIYIIKIRKKNKNE